MSRIEQEELDNIRNCVYSSLLCEHVRKQWNEKKKYNKRLSSFCNIVTDSELEK